MSAVVRDIPLTVQLAGGTGFVDFAMAGMLDYVNLQPQAPDDQATYGYYIQSKDTPGAFRANQSGLQGAKLDVVGRKATGNHRLTINSPTNPNALFQVVVTIEDERS